MATRLSSKAKELKQFEGLSVVAYFKEGAIVEDHGGKTMAGKGIAGFIVKVTNNFVYFGYDLETFDTLVDIEDIAIVRIPDDVDQLINLIGKSIEEPSGDVQ